MFYTKKKKKEEEEEEEDGWEKGTFVLLFKNSFTSVKKRK